jgi:hypothetical protein
VLFGTATDTTWSCERYVEVPVPTIVEADVNVLPTP